MTAVKILLAQKAGFCFGVRRAINIAFDALRESADGTIYSLGPLIHNPQEVVKLEEAGLCIIASLDDVPSGGTLIIPSHGAASAVKSEAAKRGLHVIDATCPFVLKAQKLAAESASQGYQVIILGDRGHPEVEAVMACADGKAVMVHLPADCDTIADAPARVLLSQTTQSFDTLRDVAMRLLNKTSELRIFNTICAATNERQHHALELAKECDLMVIVGGYNSANTNRLVEICSQDTRTIHIETAEGLTPEAISGATLIGISAGASTPDWIIDAVVHRLRELSGERQ